MDRQKKFVLPTSSEVFSDGESQINMRGNPRCSECIQNAPTLKGSSLGCHTQRRALQIKT